MHPGENPGKNKGREDMTEKTMPTPSEIRAYRVENSPLTVAYEDPVLRAQGLNSDRVGDCVQFFEITDGQMHHAFCYCHVGQTLDANQAARRLRSMLPSDSWIRDATRSLVERIGSFFAAR